MWSLYCAPLIRSISNIVYSTISSEREARLGNKRFHVVGIGNAIVDVLAKTDDAFLESNDMTKGGMTLIDEIMAGTLYGKMRAPMEQSGGSAANTIAAMASLGSDCAFIGKVCDDLLGERFTDAIRDIGVTFETPPARDTTSTARCLIFVTPDAQRTMLTYLGTCVELGPRDIDPEIIADSQITYLEGYLWDPPEAKEAFIRAADIAHQSGNKVSLSLSDAFCVDRHRDDFLQLLEGHVDILFANEQEITSLYQVDEFDEALQYVRGHCEIAALTRSEKGSVVVSGDEIHVIDAEPDVTVVDTTGAGDAYAAGFLYGLTHHLGLRDAAHVGSVAAAEVISHMGARPAEPLGSLIEHKLDFKN